MKAKIFFDGSARPNPGKMRIGVVIETDEKVLEISRDVGEGTNNVAEYLALIEGLREALKMGVDEVEVYGDSTLIVEQVNGNYRVRDERLKGLHDEALRLLSSFRRWRVEWIPERENERAHALSR